MILKKKAIEYWIKNAQAEFFSKEIFFLENNANVDGSKIVPTLVLNLNLFLDQNGI